MTPNSTKNSFGRIRCHDFSFNERKRSICSRYTPMRPRGQYLVSGRRFGKDGMPRGWIMFIVLFSHHTAVCVRSDRNLLWLDQNSTSTCFRFKVFALVACLVVLQKPQSLVGILFTSLTHHLSWNRDAQLSQNSTDSSNSIIFTLPARHHSRPCI